MLPFVKRHLQSLVHKMGVEGPTNITNDEMVYAVQMIRRHRCHVHNTQALQSLEDKFTSCFLGEPAPPASTSEAVTQA
jgi:hypothetical protein